LTLAKLSYDRKPKVQLAQVKQTITSYKTYL